MSVTIPASAVLVGHRGFPERYPENSLVGIEAALALGARAIEIDIQASADGEPVVCHDTDLKRVSGKRVSLSRHSAEQLMQVSIHEPKRFAECFAPCPLAHLRQVVELLAQFPQATLFVELKEEIFAHFSRAEFVQKVMPLLAPLAGRVVIISFDLLCLRLVQQDFATPVGWVIRRYSRGAYQQIQEHPVDVVICDWRKLPQGDEPLWSGPWQWFIYDVVDPQEAAAWCRRGVTYIETWNIGALLEHSEGGNNAG